MLTVVTSPNLEGTFMLLDQIFQPFIKQRPVCVLARAVLERILDPHHLDALFDQHAQTQYTHQLLFSSLAELMSQVVLGVHPSVYAAFRAWEARLPVGDQALYEKLQHVELPVAAALVHDSARRVAPVLEALQATLPPWLKGYHTKIIDGNHLEATEHRLKELRTTWAAPLPGKGLVVLDQPTLTASAVLLTEDGQAQERSLLDGLLPLVQRRDLWLADRNFCTFGVLFGIVCRKAAFVIRQHGTVKGSSVGERQACGRCPTGRVFEQRLRLRNDQGQVLVVRRITVELDTPTRDGDTEIHILTNLPERAAPAPRVAALYQQRWTIEGLFLEAATTLQCEINTLCYPKAALFAFCLGLLACNAVALLKGALRGAHGREAVEEKVSGYYLALEIRQTYDGMMVAIPEAHWRVFRGGSDGEFAAVLQEVAGQVVLRRYRKTPRGPKKPPPQRTRYQNGAHVATSKVLAERKGHT
jgi:Transposase DDE domain